MRAGENDLPARRQFRGAERARDGLEKWIRINAQAEAIAETVSPGRTSWVRPLGAGATVASSVDAGATGAGTSARTCPGRMMLLASRPFAARTPAVSSPCARAIAQTVSPG